MRAERTPINVVHFSFHLIAVEKKCLWTY